MDIDVCPRAGTVIENNWQFCQQFPLGINLAGGYNGGVTVRQDDFDIYRRNRMRQYETKVRETKEISKIICNKCGREIPLIEGVPREDFLEVEKHWGYFSGKDGQMDRFDLCEKCYDELVKSFRIKMGD